MILKIKKGNLSSYKIAAFKAGSGRVLFTEFEEAVKLSETEFTGGLYMEIVTAWMLGYFRKVCSVFLFVEISEYLDKKLKIDFNIKTSDTDNLKVGIDLKFDKDEADDKTASGGFMRKVVRVYPHSPGKATSKRTMTGEEALRTVLSVVMREDNLDRALSNRESFIDVINKTWERYSKGW